MKSSLDGSEDSQTFLLNLSSNKKSDRPQYLLEVLNISEAPFARLQMKTEYFFVL